MHIIFKPRKENWQANAFKTRFKRENALIISQCGLNLTHLSRIKLIYLESPLLKTTT